MRDLVGVVVFAGFAGEVAVVEFFDVVGTHGHGGHGVPVGRHRVDDMPSRTKGVSVGTAGDGAVGGVGSDPAIGADCVVAGIYHVF